jgi:hypothetical protein
LGEEVAASGEEDGVVERQHHVGRVVRVWHDHAIGATVFLSLNNKMSVKGTTRMNALVEEVADLPVAIGERGLALEVVVEQNVIGTHGAERNYRQINK